MVKLFLDLNNDSITGNWQVSNLSGLITAAHIHNGPAGVNAGMFIPFNGLPLGGTFTTKDQSPALLLKAVLDNPSAYYVNIHSTAYPGGEIRGQLACAPAEPIASPTPTGLPTSTASATSLPEPLPTPKPIISIKQSLPFLSRSITQNICFPSRISKLSKSRSPRRSNALKTPPAPTTRSLYMPGNPPWCGCMSGWRRVLIHL